MQGRASNQASAPDVSLWVVVFDLHYPEYHRPTWDAVRAILADQRDRLAGFVFGGDQFHFDSISHHNASKPLYQTPGGYERDLSGFDRHILTPLEALLPPGAARVWLVGNHERFERDVVEAMPGLQNMLDHTRLLRLRERGWTVVPQGRSYKIGKLRVLHGDVIRGGRYVAARAVELFCENVLMGHHHVPQHHTKTAARPTDRWGGWVAPVASDLFPRYLGGAPTGWINGFVLVEVARNGSFQVIPLYVTKGRVLYGGKSYGRSKTA